MTRFPFHERQHKKSLPSRCQPGTSRNLFPAPTTKKPSNVIGLSIQSHEGGYLLVEKKDFELRKDGGPIGFYGQAAG